MSKIKIWGKVALFMVAIMSIEGTIWEYSIVGLPEVSLFRYGFYDGAVYLIHNDEPFKIPEANSYYGEDFSYVWQCEGLSCGFIYSFFSLGIGIEFAECMGIPFWYVFDLAHVGNVDETQFR